MTRTFRGRWVGSASYRTEAHIDAKFILDQKPDAKITVLMQDSLIGKDYMTGIEEGLGERGKTMIVKRLTYQVTDPTIDLANPFAAGLGCRHLLRRCLAEIRRTGDTQDV